MPTIAIHLSPHLHTGATYTSSTTSTTTLLPNPSSNPLPPLLQTPTGLALVEIQGTINLPPKTPDTTSNPVGKLEFPNYDPNDVTGSKSWMKTVHLYVGKHQRLTGEVKKLPRAVAVVRKMEAGVGVEKADGETAEEEELEVVEIVEWKVVFSTRPEPVGD